MALDLTDGYLTLRQLVRYSGLSMGTLRRDLKRSDRPLPHYRHGRRILIRKSEFDRWLQEDAPRRPPSSSPQRPVSVPVH